ncbi:hypothetical protein DFO66_10877 [Brevibacterium sanguinis]|uniref:NAD(P)-binding protein n=2 Tax=Brevibacterium TaxID=1696 RepID=A0A366IJU3_9MICO|nr:MULTISPECIES: NAD(P)-dependent oxidoreductase [Brevibacterium]RBP63981.1 hypothetical protein DFO66_10877 [Brevibacterium sanguinis]RBP70744.1 hypothetical protein DFO65_10762 [Brevibacterium celere]
MDILIIGASGHVGGLLAETLAADHRIRGLVRTEPESAVPYSPVVVPDWVERPEAVAEAVGEPRQVDAVIAALGGWYVDGPMLERGLGAFDADCDSHLRSHFAACQVSTALAQDRGQDGARRRLTHVALNGVASIEACVGSGAISVFGAAQEMLIRVAAAESESVHFRELKILAPVAGDERNDLTGGVETVSVSAVASAAEHILREPTAHQTLTSIHAF